MKSLDTLLSDAADKTDRKDSPAIVKLLKENYDFCKSLGLSEGAIQETLGLTSVQMRQLKKL